MVDAMKRPVTTYDMCKGRNEGDKVNRFRPGNRGVDLLLTMTTYRDSRTVIQDWQFDLRLLCLSAPRDDATTESGQFKNR
jgi:hypothetical protein